MKLIDLLAICNENVHMTVCDTDDNLLAVYDGKNSIDEKYNNCNVLGIGGRSNSRYEAIDVIVEVE